MTSSRAIESGRFAYGFEIASWLMTILLGSLMFLLPEAAAPDRQFALAIVVATLAVTNIVIYRVVPESSEAPIRFAKEDKALAVSLLMVLLLSVYIYVLPEAAPSLSYLYLIPLFASTLVLHEHVVLSEAVFSLVAMLFLRAVEWVSGPFWQGELALRVAVFAAAAACLVIVTRALRLAFSRADRLSGELSVRLDQIQVINMLVRQSEYTSQIELLASRAGGIIADAIDAERHVIFVLESDGKSLRAVGEGGGTDFYDRELMSVEENLQVLRGVLETGASHVFGEEPGGVEKFVGNARIRNMLVVPLRVRETPVGLMCLVNRRSGAFLDEDIHYCELLAGFVATLMNAALLFQRTLDERKTVERMAKLMVGREIKMRELKSRLKDVDV